MGRERGYFVALVGPDGVGKTSVAAELISRTGGRYFHFKPPLRRRWALPQPGEIVPVEQRRRPGALVTVLRFSKAFLSFWLGYLTSVRPEVNSGKIVVADRWAYGYLVHPWKLGTLPAPSVAKIMLRVMPQPDMVFALVADPVAIYKRKQELTHEQTAEEMEAWASLPVPQLFRIDANQSINDVVDAIMNRIDDD